MLKKNASLKKSATDQGSDDDVDSDESASLASNARRGAVRHGLKNASQANDNAELITLRVDADIADWFNEHGDEHEAQINALLRKYMQSKA